MFVLPPLFDCYWLTNPRVLSLISNTLDTVNRQIAICICLAFICFSWIWFDFVAAGNLQNLYGALHLFYHADKSKTTLW